MIGVLWYWWRVLLLLMTRLWMLRVAVRVTATFVLALVLEDV